MKISKKFQKQAEIYKFFARDSYNNLDFSIQSLEEMYKYETFGKPKIEFNIFDKVYNGYAVGKKMVNITIDIWFDSIERFGWFIVLDDLYNDPEFKSYHWWLDKIFKNYISKYRNIIK